MRKRVFSGIQPTGNIHIGNYLAAMKHWVAIQEEYDCVYCLVDLHAITVPQDPHELKSKTRELAGLLFSVGIDPDRSSVFVQSAIGAHAELAWILNCFTPMGWMYRMTQFKEKSEKMKEKVSVGLFDYPALMAADILGPKANLVPVGEDQTQHLEISREIARHFNSHFRNIFPEPTNYLADAIRVPGLDGSNKMGKSDGNTIQLDHTPEKISSILSCAVTDPARKRRSDPGNPMLCNIFSIEEIMSNAGYALSLSLEELASRCRKAEHGCIDCKRILHSSIVELTEPIRQRKSELLANRPYLIEILKAGSGKARERIRMTLAEMRAALKLAY